MEVLAVFFVLVMFAAAAACTVLMGLVVGFWAAVVFAGLLLGGAWLIARGEDRAAPLRPEELNAFQQPLADADPQPPVGQDIMITLKISTQDASGRAADAGADHPRA